MGRATRRWSRLLLVVVLAIAVLSTPALGHAGHESHGGQEGSGLSIWHFLLVFGTVTAGGSLLAGRRFDVPRQHVVGLAVGGGAMALLAGIVWLV